MAILFHLSRVVERRLGNVGLGALAGLIFFVSLTGAFSVSGSSDTALPGLTTTTAGPATTTPAAVVTTTSIKARNGLDGYAAVNFTVTAVGAGTTGKNFCGLLAASSAQQAAGLMNHSDLGGFDGMIFPFQSDTTAAFYMANVPTSLSVAWFDKDGKFVSSADMEPCKTEASKCQLYKPAGPYRTAIETLKGGLGALGIGSGASMSVGSSGPC